MNRSRFDSMKNRLILVTALVMVSSPAFGASDNQESRRLMQEGAILPLQQILDVIGKERKGRVLEVELERKNDKLVYEIELLGGEGRAWEYEVDATTGEILERELEE